MYNHDVLRDYFKSDFTENQFGLQQTIGGLQEDIRTLRRSFPDFTVLIEDIAIDGDKDWVDSLRDGPQRSYEATNRKTNYYHCFRSIRLEDGKIVEHWGSPDRIAA